MDTTTSDAASSPVLPVPPRRSLVLWALLSLAMVVLSYLLILVMAAGCVAFTLFLFGNQHDPVTLVYDLMAVAIAAALLWSLVPRREAFQAPGALLVPKDNPRLFAELEGIAARLHEPMPEEVYLIPECNAFVADAGGQTGRRSYRIMGLGFPLLAGLTVDELRAVIAHEFGHYYTGDTRLAPWINKGRKVMLQASLNLGRVQRFLRFGFAVILYRLIQWVVEKYWVFFLWANGVVSRRQEFRADELACRVAGPAALISGLKKLRPSRIAFASYWDDELLPRFQDGLLPPIAEGFALFLQAPAVARQVEETIERGLAGEKTGRYDTHPPLRERVAAAEKLADALPFAPASNQPAHTLLGNLHFEEAKLLEFVKLPVATQDLLPFEWSELPARRIVRWRALALLLVRAFGEISAETLPAAAARLRDAGAKIPDPPGMLLTPGQRTQLAAGVLTAALSLALVNAGWPLVAAPGDEYFAIEDQRVRPAELVGGLADGEISRHDWEQRCRALKIEGVQLIQNEKPLEFHVETDG